MELLLLEEKRRKLRFQNSLAEKGRKRVFEERIERRMVKSDL